MMFVQLTVLPKPEPRADALQHLARPVRTRPVVPEGHRLVMTDAARIPENAAMLVYLALFQNLQTATSSITHHVSMVTVLMILPAVGHAIPDTTNPLTENPASKTAM